MERMIPNLIRNLLDAWNAHDVERVVAFYSPEYEGVDVAQAAPHRGRDGMRKYLQLYLGAFPDLQIAGDDLIEDQNRVSLVWTARGTHRGTVMHIPPTGRAVRVRGVTILTTAEGYITRALYVWDVAGLLREIGLLPELQV